MRQANSKLAYVCAPYAGNVNNHKQLAKYYAQITYEKNRTPITPHYLFPFLNDNKPKHRELALAMSKQVMLKCDEIWVFTDYISAGMRQELKLWQQTKTQHAQVVKFTGRRFKTQKTLINKLLQPN